MTGQSALSIIVHRMMPVVMCIGIIGTSVGCGAAQHSSSGAEKTKTSSGELAQHSILLRSYLGHGWTDAGPANDVVLSACSTSSIRAGLSAHADSHAFTFGQSFKLATSSYIYANRAEARRAVSGFAATTMLSCVARAGASSIRSAHYVTGSPHISQTSTLAAGEVARRVHIEIPAQYGGKSFLLRMDITIIQQGRVVGLLNTVAEVPEAQSGELAKLSNAHDYYALALGKLLAGVQQNGSG